MTHNDVDRFSELMPPRPGETPGQSPYPDQRPVPGPLGPRTPYPVDDPGIADPTGPGADPDYIPATPAQPVRF